MYPEHRARLLEVKKGFFNDDPTSTHFTWVGHGRIVELVAYANKSTPKPTTTAKTKNNPTMGSASKVGAGEIKFGAGEIRFGFSDISIGSMEFVTVSITLSATLAIILILDRR